MNFGIRDMTDGAYLREFDPEYRPEGAEPDSYPCGAAWWTGDVEKAKRFDSVSDALKLIATQSVTCPLRPDMMPNKPMSYYSVEFIQLP